MTYRILPRTSDSLFLIVESKTEFEQMEKGMLEQHALDDPAVIVTPERAPALNDEREWEVRSKCENEFSKVFYSFNPMDVVGWKGDLTARKINMRDIRPVMSPRADLPPGAHTTFATGSAVGLQLCDAAFKRGSAGAAGPIFSPERGLRRVLVLSRRRFFQP